MNKELIYRFVEGLDLDKNRKNVVYNLIANLEQEINKPDITLATSTTIGGIKIGYVNTSKKYPVQLDSDGKAYVEVPWTDNNTTYNLVGVKGSTGLIKNGSDVTSPEGYVPCPIINGIPYYKESVTPASAEPAVAVLEREK